MIDLGQHQVEIARNQAAWGRKTLLREIYRGFYERIRRLIDPSLTGLVVEVGSGIGNLKEHLPEAVTTDLFPNPWLDVVCDGYEMPFASGTVSHLILFDVFHHLRAPLAFLHEARRVLVHQGRVILFEPYISAASYPVYGLFHHEPVGLKSRINSATSLPRPRDYYAAQGNATRMFFREQVKLDGWRVFHTEAFASFAYLLSGGFSKRALYPQRWLKYIGGMDRQLSIWPQAFGARCLVALTPEV